MLYFADTFVVVFIEENTRQIFKGYSKFLSHNLWSSPSSVFPFPTFAGITFPTYVFALDCWELNALEACYLLQHDLWSHLYCRIASGIWCLTHLFFWCLYLFQRHFHGIDLVRKTFSFLKLPAVFLMMTLLPLNQPTYLHLVTCN